LGWLLAIGLVLTVGVATDTWIEALAGEGLPSQPSQKREGWGTRLFRMVQENRQQQKQRQMRGFFAALRMTSIFAGLNLPI
jgi:hypothetical protein